MRRVLLAAIRGYQRYVSPHKGFSCAYRVHTGRASCSALGYRTIRRFGVVAGLRLLRQRTALCGVAHRRHAGFKPRHPHAAQRGDCDLGCDLPGDCDVPHGKIGLGACDMLSCCDCGSCDWPDRKRKRPRDEQFHLPPKRARERRPTL